MISLVIPVTSSNQEYTRFATQKIRELYPSEEEVEIVVEINDDVSLGINYNNAVEKASGEIVVLMHNDMVPHPGFVETILKHIKRKRVLYYHRVEPPIYKDLFPGKTICDFGTDIKNYNENAFFSHRQEDTLIDGGSQLFFAVYKEDYLKIDGYTFKMFCEDDDVILRYKLAGYDIKIANAAMVYHFVSKTSRSGDYKSIELESNLAFVRKWGFRYSQYNKVYKKYIKINGTPPEDLKKALELFSNSSETEADLVAEINVSTFTQDDYKYITQLNDIVFENNEIGTFELGNVILTIKSLNSFEQDLIFIS